VGIAPMEDPEYIVLVALDTPSRSTGMYISGGVMAAPTVGSVMADILPYLDVEQNFTEEQTEGKKIVVEDLGGLTKKQVESKLKEQGLSAVFIGQEETVTGQIPEAGQIVPGGSQLVVYLGDTPGEETVTMPDFAGMHRQQAADAAGKLGLYILATGNTEVSPNIKVIYQDIAPGTVVKPGTTVELRFADTKISD